MHLRETSEHFHHLASRYPSTKHRVQDYPLVQWCLCATLPHQARVNSLHYQVLGIEEGLVDTALDNMRARHDYLQQRGVSFESTDKNCTLFDDETEKLDTIISTIEESQERCIYVTPPSGQHKILFAGVTAIRASYIHPSLGVPASNQALPALVSDVADGCGTLITIMTLREYRIARLTGQIGPHANGVDRIYATYLSHDSREALMRMIDTPLNEVLVTVHLSPQIIHDSAKYGTGMWRRSNGTITSGDTFDFAYVTLAFRITQTGCHRVRLHHCLLRWCLPADIKPNDDVRKILRRPGQTTADTATFADSLVRTPQNMPWADELTLGAFVSPSAACRETKTPMERGQFKCYECRRNDPNSQIMLIGSDEHCLQCGGGVDWLAPSGRQVTIPLKDIWANHEGLVGNNSDIYACLHMDYFNQQNRLLHHVKTYLAEQAVGNKDPKLHPDMDGWQMAEATNCLISDDPSVLPRDHSTDGKRCNPFRIILRVTPNYNVSSYMTIPLSPIGRMDCMRSPDPNGNVGERKALPTMSRNKCCSFATTTSGTSNLCLHRCTTLVHSPYALTHMRRWPHIRRLLTQIVPDALRSQWTHLRKTAALHTCAPPIGRST